MDPTLHYAAVIDVGRPRGAEDLRAYCASLADAFAWEDIRGAAMARKWAKRVGVAKMRVARVGGRVAGGLVVYEMGQWFGGRRVPMTGVAAVGVSPEHRSRGVASRLMRAAVEEMRTPLACLYPATQPVYRRVGFEQAGTYVAYTLPTRTIDARDRALAMRAASRSDERTIRRINAEAARRTNGVLDRCEPLWERIFRPFHGRNTAYLAGDEGYVIFGLEPGRQAGHYDLYVRDMAALTPAAGRRLLTFFADHRSLGDSVKFAGGPQAPLLMLAAEQEAEVTRVVRWMLRLIDVKGALEARGYGAVEAEAHLDVRDDVLPRNHGRWVLAVSHGRARVRKGGRGAVKIDVRTLASLYSGYVSPAELGIDMPAVFAGPSPWMGEIF